MISNLLKALASQVLIGTPVATSIYITDKLMSENKFKRTKLDGVGATYSDGKNTVTLEYRVHEPYGVWYWTITRVE